MKFLIIKILDDLIKFRSISPNDDGAIEYCKSFLENLGFLCQALSFYGVNNLYAKFGNNDKNLCFAGHVDVVSPLSEWNTNPFELNIVNGIAYGRGVNDMKGPLSSCLAAIRDIITEGLLPNDVSLSVLLTSDEEIMGDFGTKSVISYLKKINEKITGCVLCESCSEEKSGEYIKIGCRGSLNIDIISSGTQCHVANSSLIGNHIHKFIEKLAYFCGTPLDSGSQNFSPSSIQLTSIDSGENNVRNIVPSKAKALLNIRFNDNWTFKTLKQYVTNIFFDEQFSISFEGFGSPFIGSSPKFVEFLAQSIEQVTGDKPNIGTKGGNSDALFIKDITDVVEIGSPICNAHIVNEFIELDDLTKLYNIYKNIMLLFASRYNSSFL
ncbi:MAG: succinyl-diaminopimelate desuccinylase [Holosporales bacterium]|nr:succinyl-diaminopimelate desuccinylase [Holosporales bacterium]